MSDLTTSSKKDRLRLRLDQALVDRGTFESRTRAQGAIKAGLVFVDGIAVTRPGHAVQASAQINVTGDLHSYVSRAAIKLEAGLDQFHISPSGKTCMDVGASTGGFTDVLLQRGAAKVFAVDVGTDQLHSRLRGDARVISLEQTHIRDLANNPVRRQAIGAPIDLIVCDVSFISLLKALPHALTFAAETCALIALIKPQFELGPEYIGKGGIVRADDAVISALCDDVAAWLKDEGFSIVGLIDSPISGGDGNKEFLIGAAR